MNRKEAIHVILGLSAHLAMEAKDMRLSGSGIQAMRALGVPEEEILEGINTAPFLEDAAEKYRLRRTP